MDDAVRSALIAEARKFGVVGDDVVDLFPDVTTGIAKDGVVDAQAVSDAIKALMERVPSLFNPPKAWDEIESEDEYRTRDAAFRESLRRSRPLGDREFKDLDASRLSDDELHALSRCVAGQQNSWDKGLLTRALARQRAEDGALGGAAS